MPLALDQTYTYSIPQHLEEKIEEGFRVEVAFGSRKLYSGIVARIHIKAPDRKLHAIIAILDDAPVISSTGLRFWQWMADYYRCSIGEVMIAALPARLKLQSETAIQAGPALEDEIYDLTGHEERIAKAILAQESLSIHKIKDLLQIQSVYPYIKDMLERDIIKVEEDLLDTYKPKTVIEVRLIQPYQTSADRESLFAQTSNASGQTRVLLVMLDLLKKGEPIKQSELLKRADGTYQIMQALERKGIIERAPLEVSRLANYEGDSEGPGALNAAQEIALKEISSVIPEKPILLRGVTGSGKTRIYIELIQEQLALGKQVLYLVPEIALTTQMVSRLEKVFGGLLLTFHSRMSSDAQVEVWQRCEEGSRLFLGARSSLFLPFQDLGLIIVDEEHDYSYKQSDPAPRYHARDASIVLGSLHGAGIILGSATPALESHFNVKLGKYTQVLLETRFGDMPMPEIILADLRKEIKGEFFSQLLLDEIQKTHEDGFQTILFQNRRGFAPVMFCSNCGWHKECRNCDTTLVFHRFKDEMRCHLCGYAERPVVECGDCGSTEITLKGFGTEMIEDELKLLLPEYRIARLDLDTARGRKKLSALIHKFAAGEYDILVGTQMVTKGLDFENVGLVGVVNADQLLHYPDFRAAERGFQLMTQVAGRAGRKHRRGKVIIQSRRIGHPVIQEVLRGDFDKFAERELSERKEFLFPPYVRLIKVTIRHRDAKRSMEAASRMVQSLKEKLGDRVQGPLQPGVGRVRNKYIFEILLKLEKDAPLISKTKLLLKSAITRVKKLKGLSTASIQVNVDP